MMTASTSSSTKQSKCTYDDVNLLLRLYDMRREDRLRQARAWFAGKFRAATMDEFQKLCPPGSDENASFRQVTSYWDMVASFINQGVLNENLFFENTRELLLAYIRIEPILPAVREAFKDPFYMSNLESVAKRFAGWLDQRSPGTYSTFAARVK
jgi:hypothetical protein